MHDDLERTAESVALSSARGTLPMRYELVDVAGAIRLAETIVGSRVSEDGLTEAFEIAEKGERSAVVMPTEHVAAQREKLRRIASARVPLVVHVLAGHGAEDLASIADVGWGVLSAAGPADAFDLALIARRASEDASVPFMVVHALARAEGAAGRAIAMIPIPQDRALHGFVGSPRPRSDRAASGDRAFAERVPFALGSALRDYGAISGRARADAFEKAPLGESPLVLVGTGPIGEAVVAAVPDLRTRGYDVAAVNVASLRPFPGARLVKAFARALAVTVLEPADEPFANGGLLARDVKAAFTDAITWLPGYPGIGRIPKLFVGATGPSFDIADLAAVCENMLADERGRRIFTFTDVEHSLPRPSRAAPPPDRDFAMRLVLDDASSAEAVLQLVAACFAKALGLRTQGIVTATMSGASAILDVVASREGARGAMARRPPRIVVATARGVASAGAIVPLHDRVHDDPPILAVLSSDSGAVPEAARTVVREQRARVLPLVIGESRSLAIVCGGAALAAASRALKIPLDGNEAAKAIAEAGENVDIERAKKAFETTRDALVTAARDRDPGRPIGNA
jgi:pyruvate ferredoxin oxidoreductase alpha subunit